MNLSLNFSNWYPVMVYLLSTLNCSPSDCKVFCQIKPEKCTVSELWFNTINNELLVACDLTKHQPYFPTWILLSWNPWSTSRHFFWQTLSLVYSTSLVSTLSVQRLSSIATPVEHLINAEAMQFSTNWYAAAAGTAIACPSWYAAAASGTRAAELQHVLPGLW